MRTSSRRYAPLVAVAVGAAACAAPPPAAAPAPAQTAASPDAPQSRAAPPANPADVASIDALLGALYDVISGPAGEPRDWDRMRSLFVPGARMGAVRPARGDTAATATTFDVERYIERNGPVFNRVGFWEREIDRRTERWGNLAHAWSTYQARVVPAEGAEETLRGINSIQLLNDGTRWWVVNIFWDAERPDNPIPPEYMGAAGRPSAP